MRRIRKELGFTQRQLAERLGVHHVTVARWEAGITPVAESTARFLKLIRANARGKSGKDQSSGEQVGIDRRRRVMDQPTRGRKGQPPRTVYMSIGVKLEPTDGHIYIFGYNDQNFVTSVNNIPGSKRHHANLYRKLRAVLMRKKKWPRGME